MMGDRIVFPFFLMFVVALVAMAGINMSREIRQFWIELKSTRAARGFDVLPPRKPWAETRFRSE